MLHAKEKLPTNGAKVNKKGWKIHDRFAIIKLWIKLNSTLHIIHTTLQSNIEERNMMLKEKEKERKKNS